MANEKEIVLVIGGNSSISLEIVRKLIRDNGSRFYVFVGSRKLSNRQRAVDEIIAEGYGDVEAIQLDVTHGVSLTSATKKILERFGKLDVLHVNVRSPPDLVRSNHLG